MSWASGPRPPLISVKLLTQRMRRKKFLTSALIELLSTPCHFTPCLSKFQNLFGHLEPLWEMSLSDTSGCCQSKQAVTWQHIWRDVTLGRHFFLMGLRWKEALKHHMLEIRVFFCEALYPRCVFFPLIKFCIWRCLGVLMGCYLGHALVCVLAFCCTDSSIICEQHDYLFKLLWFRFGPLFIFSGQLGSICLLPSANNFFCQCSIL